MNKSTYETVGLEQGQVVDVGRNNEFNDHDWVYLLLIDKQTHTSTLNDLLLSVSICTLTWILSGEFLLWISHAPHTFVPWVFDGVLILQYSPGYYPVSSWFLRCHTRLDIIRWAPALESRIRPPLAILSSLGFSASDWLPQSFAHLDIIRWLPALESCRPPFAILSSLGFSLPIDCHSGYYPVSSCFGVTCTLVCHRPYFHPSDFRLARSINHLILSAFLDYSGQRLHTFWQKRSIGM